MVLELIGKTLAGKNKVRNAMLKIAENSWAIVETRDKVQFSQEKGPWVKIRPIEADRVTADLLSRWVHLTDDKDLKLVQSKCNFTENYD